MSSIVSARELAEREKKRLETKKATYRAILEQFSRKISNAALLGKHDILLTTPRFIIGYPAYNIITATSYIQRQLNRLGYTTQRAMGHVIHISWAKPPRQGPVVIDHSREEEQHQLPNLANLAKTAQKIRAHRNKK